MNNLLTFPKITKTDFIPVYLFLAFIFLNTGNLSAQDSDTELSNSEIKELVENASERLKKVYVYKEVGEEVAGYISSRLKEDAYDTLLTQENFARVMTADMQSISHDKHMRVRLRRQRQSINSNSDQLLTNIC